MKMLLNSSLSNLYYIGIINNREMWAAGPRDGGRHSFIKFRKTVNLKISIEHRNLGNNAAEFERQEIVIKRKRVNETKSLVDVHGAPHT